ncbi:outer membrane protein assembly factor BamE [Microvirga sp. 2TAF3]|uniref:outer membrane protein assembly factor BamE n=1 Tax=Microvirga sp. 2TAF3 TaxID=3233014 RepID=UPI003F948194
MRRYHTLFVRLAAATFLASSLAGCMGGEEFHRGYLVDERAVSEVKKGMSAEQVLTTLGTPSTVSTVGNKNWYYISQKSRRTFQFLGEQVVDQQVTAVYFDKNLKVERIALYGLQDGQVFDFISRTTPAGGQESSFLTQLFRGTNNLNPFGV